MVSEVPEDYNPVSLEIKILEEWEKIDIYDKLKQLRSEGPKFFFLDGPPYMNGSVSYTHLRAHETPEHLVCRLLLEKKNKITY